MIDVITYPIKAVGNLFSLKQLARFSSRDGWQEKAFAKSLRKAKRGDAQAQNDVGQMYYTGSGVDKDIGSAVEWYRQSAAQGNPEGQNRLGLMYEKGTGVSLDVTKAMEWYQKSAVQGFCTAQYNLARIYAGSDAELQDYILAKMWADIAVAGGLKHVAALGQLLSVKMTDDQIEEARHRADTWLQEHPVEESQVI